MAELGMGVVGFGFIGSIHAKAAMNCALTDLVGVWTLPDRTQENLKRIYPDRKTYGSLEEMAEDRAVHAVVIGTPNKLHLPQAKLFIESGKHVLVEKPMALNVAEALEMTEAARAAGVRLMVGHMWRFDREVLALRELVASGDLGEIVKTKSYGIHQDWGPSGWFTQREMAGGGALIDMGVHALDTTRFLLGDPMPSSVYAVLATRYGQYDVDDTGILVVKWDNGVTSLVESGWWNPHMDGPEASTQLFATRGYARVFPTAARVGVDRVSWRPRFPQREDHCDQHIYDGQMAEFASAILDERDPVPGARQGLVILRICEAAYESARTNRVVDLSR